MSMSWWRRTVWCALWSALAAAPSAGAALNLLTDGGFEKGTIQLGDCERVTGSLPLSWADNSCWFNATRVDYDQVPSPAHQGRALKVQLRQGLFQIAQPVALQLDWRYEASVWLRSAEPMVVRVALRQAAPPYADYGSRYMRTSDQWVQVKVNAFTHGLTAAQARQALFMVGSATPGTLWVDDAALSGAAVPLALPGPPPTLAPTFTTCSTATRHSKIRMPARFGFGMPSVRNGPSSSRAHRVERRRSTTGQPWTAAWTPWAPTMPRV